MTGLIRMREALAAGRTSSRALVTAAFAAADANQHLNVFTSLDREGALKAASLSDEAYRLGRARPLEGLPITIKDNLAVAGQPFTGGSRAIGNAPAAADAGTVAILRNAGAIIIGKTNLHEFAFGVTSNNSVYGPVANPKIQNRSAGGSSGGAAASVAAHIVPAALGTDTGGSGRIPAAFCGCVGFRPTTGRYSATGVIQITWTLDTVAVFASDPADLALLDQLLSETAASLQPPPKPAGLKLGVPHGSFAANLDAPVAAAFDKALSRLEAAGIALVPVDLGEVMRHDRAGAFPIAMFEAEALWRCELTRRNIDPASFIAKVASPDVRIIFEHMFGNGTSVSDYAQAMNEALTPLRHIYARMFARQGVDAIVFPTVPVPPPPLQEDEIVLLNGQPQPLFPTIVRNTSPGSLAGIPGISLPFGSLTDGAPFGLELDGPAGGDARLLAIAQTIAGLSPRTETEG